MSYVEQYRDTIGYDWVLMRQLDRIAEARSRLHGRIARAEYERRVAEYRAAIYALYIMLPPSARERLVNPRGFDVKSLDEWLSEAVAVLDRLGLLMKKRGIMVGGDVEIHS